MANRIRGKRTPRGEGSGRWGMGDAAVDGLPAKNLMGQPWRAAFALQDAGSDIAVGDNVGQTESDARKRQ